MAKPLKYLRGPLLTSLHEVVCEMQADRVIIFNCGGLEKRLTASFYQNWSLRQITMCLGNRQLYRALENREWFDKEYRRIANAINK